MWGAIQPRTKIWRQIWRVAGRESDSPELLGSPRTSPEVPQTSPEVFRRLPRKFSHCGAYQQSRGSPEVSQTSPDFPGRFPDFPGGQPLSLGSLTPSLDSQNLSLKNSEREKEPKTRNLEPPPPQDKTIGDMRELAVTQESANLWLLFPWFSGGSKSRPEIGPLPGYLRRLGFSRQALLGTLCSVLLQRVAVFFLPVVKSLRETQRGSTGGGRTP